VRLTGRDVILCSRIEIRGFPDARGFESLELPPILPPLTIVLVRLNLVLERVPPPFLHGEGEWKKGHFGQCLIVEEIDVILIALVEAFQEADLLEMFGRGDGVGNRVTQGLMESFM